MTASLPSIDAARADDMQRAMDVVKLHGGRATLEQIRAARVIRGPLVTEVMRALVSGKRLTMDGESTYVVVKSPAAELRQLAGAPSTDTDRRGQREQTTVKSAPAPAEPRPPRQKGARKDRDTNADSGRKIPCVRCRAEFPPDVYARPKPFRRWRLCPACRAPGEGGERSAPVSKRETDEPVPPLIAEAARLGRAAGVDESADPITLDQIVAKVAKRTTGGLMFIDLRALPEIERYLARLVLTGLYGESITDAAERLICAGIQAAITAGLITPEKAR